MFYPVGDVAIRDDRQRAVTGEQYGNRAGEFIGGKQRDTTETSGRTGSA
jgi:hypothetical protein